MHDDDSEIREALARAEPVIVGVRARRVSRHNFPKVEPLRLPATPEGGKRLHRWLPGGANRGGRTTELTRRLADYQSAILALADRGYRPSEITAGVVLQRLHRTGNVSQLRKDVAAPAIGGWKEFRAGVLRAR